jgi:RNA polymerase sigma factor, sigma-70 family
MDFEALYKRHFKDIYLFCLSLGANAHMAEDITSEAFLKAIRAADSFKGNCSVKAWLCQIAKNTYYDALRKHSKTIPLPPDMPSDSQFETAIFIKDDAFKIHKLLHCLQEPYKEVFSLRVFSELRFSEIGEIFDKTESWARVTFHRAKSKLKELNQNETM